MLVSGIYGCELKVNYQTKLYYITYLWKIIPNVYTLYFIKSLMGSKVAKTVKSTKCIDQTLYAINTVVSTCRNSIMPLPPSINKMNNHSH